MVRKNDEPERTAAGRHVTPLGIRTGGKAWLQIHSTISTASLEVLAEAGWGLFTVEAVADRAEVSKRTVYRYFPDKESLAVAGIRILPTYNGWGRCVPRRELQSDGWWRWCDRSQLLGCWVGTSPAQRRPGRNGRNRVGGGIE